MTIAASPKTDSIRGRVSPEEWQARVDLAACYRLIARYGMSDLIYNHITVRVPGEEGHLLINSYGMLYEEMTASSLIKIDLDGKILDDPGTGYGVNEAGYVIHGAVHAARPDVAAVIHTHARASMAVSMMECGLLPLSQHAMRFSGQVSYHEYEGVALDIGERERLIADFGPTNNVMFLRNHGLLVASASLPEAFNACYYVEMACKAQVDAMNSRTELHFPAPEVMERTAHQYAPSTRRPYGQMEWPAMLRLLAREGANYDI
jgi:ribulose-5-phosphate 4-epimerase/fuculose-1-phosphate aldolase